MKHIFFRMTNTSANTEKNVKKNHAIDIYQILRKVIVSSISFKLKESRNKTLIGAKRSSDLQWIQNRTLNICGGLKLDTELPYQTPMIRNNQNRLLYQLWTQTKNQKILIRQQQVQNKISRKQVELQSGILYTSN